MSQCRACFRKCDVFLCATCVSNLRATFNDLPWWLSRLSEAAAGRVKLGDGGRATRRREPFKGDDEALTRCKCGHSEHELIACRVIDREVREVETVPTEDDEATEPITHTMIIEKQCACDDYEPAMTQEKLRAKLLASGRVNSRALDRLDEVRNSLTTWVRHIAETRGIRFVRPTFVGPLLPGHVRMGSSNLELLAFLRAHVGAIACDEAAGEILGVFQDHVRAIEKVINRPVPRKYLGPCPTWREAADDTEATIVIEGKRYKACGFDLNAIEDAIEITCPQCRKTHNCNWLQMALQKELESTPLPREKILKANRIQPDGHRISENTLRHWFTRGNLKPHSVGAGGEPRYLWSDVIKLRSERPKRKLKAV